MSTNYKYLLGCIVLIILVGWLLLIQTKPKDIKLNDQWLTADMESTDGSVRLSFIYPKSLCVNGPGCQNYKTDFETIVDDPNYAQSENFKIELINIDATSSSSWMSKNINDMSKGYQPPQHTSGTLIGRPAEIFEWNYGDGHSARISDVILSEHTVLEIYEKLPEIGKDPMTDEQKRLAAEYDAHFARYHAIVQQIINSIKVEEIK